MDAPSPTFLNSVPEPTSGLCPVHSWHPLWRWEVREGEGGPEVLSVCLVGEPDGPCGRAAAEWRDGEDVTFLLLRTPHHPDRNCWVLVGQVRVSMGVDEDDNPRPALIIRAASDVAQARAKELTV